ncbi:hypothetical protein AX16_009677 [Volvariella volvacea WC 439]|nr:hypothetical protein AX16_009677 [Volvariella volvacea WC 439]
MNHYLAAFLLNTIHLVYSFTNLLLQYFRPKPRPRPLTAPRNRLPNHLAILFITQSKSPSTSIQHALLKSVATYVSWCKVVGIPKLTVYDQHGILLKSSQLVQERLLDLCEPDDSDSSGSDLEYPLTPPPSDYAESRPLSPEQSPQQENSATIIHIPDKVARVRSSKRLNVLTRRHVKEQKRVEKVVTLCITSRLSAKPTIASVAHSLSSMYKAKPGNPQLSIQSLNSILEETTGLSEPDFMIVHPTTLQTAKKLPPELHGFPPWQIRLTELHFCSLQSHNAPSENENVVSTSTLSEMQFCTALDEFASAEMRFGK